MINANIIIGKYIDRKGLAQVMLQVSIDRKVKRYSLFKAEPAAFDAKRQQMRGNHNRENAIINETLSKINNINLQMQQAGEKPSFTALESALRRTSAATFDYILSEYALNEHYITIVRRFRKMFPDVEFGKVTPAIAQLFADQLKRQGLRNYSIHNYIKTMSTLYSKAISRGDFGGANPFSQIPTSTKAREREYLTDEELRILEDFTVPRSTIMRDRDIFLFQCYTGLRTSDVKQLRWSDIQDGAIVLRQQKTQNTAYIPLSSRAMSILKRQDRNAERVFDVKTTYKTTGVQELMRAAGITKHITSHCGRHTFAVQSLNRRIPIEVVSKLLGHSDLKTTQIYAKVANPLIRDYMRLWEDD